MPDYTVTELDLSNRKLTHILHCYNNQLISLDNLPPNLQTLHCSNNQLTRLDFRGSDNDRLESAFDTSLDILPLTLQELHCRKNPIYTTCRQMYGFELSIKTMKQYNEIKRIENLEK